MTGVVNANVQLGDSGTATQNFTLTVPAVPDGTMKLARGNHGGTTQDILTVDAAGKVTLTQNVQSLVSFNTTDRNGGVTYTNNTGQPITVMATLVASVADASVAATLTGGIILRGSCAGPIGTSSFISFVVPSGGTYNLAMNAGTSVQNSWVELR